MRNLPTTFDALSCVQDELSGVRVPARFYHDDDLSIFDGFTYDDDEYDGFYVPFAVTVYSDGMDYDIDGNAYFDDYPSWFAVSYHRTRKSAEVAAAYHMDMCPNQPVEIVENYWIDGYEARYVAVEIG